MPADFLDLAGRDVLVMGVANRRSVAWHVAQVLTDAGARVIYAVRSPERAESVRQMVGSDAVIITCDVQQPADIQRLATEVASVTDTLHGVVHSIAFADYSAGWLPFHETPRSAFLQAVDISCFSLVAVSNALSDLLDPDHGSVVTISISTTRMTAENYGYMAPVKAALLKTSASAGIPGYVDSFLYAEQATLRKQAVQTDEVAAAVAFLLSPRSSGINAQGLVIDAGMGVNYFDDQLVRGPSETDDAESSS